MKNIISRAQKFKEISNNKKPNISLPLNFHYENGKIVHYNLVKKTQNENPPQHHHTTSYLDEYKSISIDYDETMNEKSRLIPIKQNDNNISRNNKKHNKDIYKIIHGDRSLPRGGVISFQNTKTEYHPFKIKNWDKIYECFDEPENKLYLEKIRSKSEQTQLPFPNIHNQPKQYISNINNTINKLKNKNDYQIENINNFIIKHNIDKHYYQRKIKTQWLMNVKIGTFTFNNFSQFTCKSSKLQKANNLNIFIKNISLCTKWKNINKIQSPILLKYESFQKCLSNKKPFSLLIEKLPQVKFIPQKETFNIITHATSNTQKGVSPLNDIYQDDMHFKLGELILYSNTTEKQSKHHIITTKKDKSVLYKENIHFSIIETFNKHLYYHKAMIPLWKRMFSFYLNESLSIIAKIKIEKNIQQEISSFKLMFLSKLKQKKIDLLRKENDIMFNILSKKKQQFQLTKMNFHFITEQTIKINKDTQISPRYNYIKTNELKFNYIPLKNQQFKISNINTLSIYTKPKPSWNKLNIISNSYKTTLFPINYNNLISFYKDKILHIWKHHQKIFYFHSYSYIPKKIIFDNNKLLQNYCLSLTISQNLNKKKFSISNINSFSYNSNNKYKIFKNITLRKESPLQFTKNADKHKTKLTIEQNKQLYYKSYSKWTNSIIVYPSFQNSFHLNYNIKSFSLNNITSITPIYFHIKPTSQNISFQITTKSFSFNSSFILEKYYFQIHLTKWKTQLTINIILSFTLEPLNLQNDFSIYTNRFSIKSTSSKCNNYIIKSINNIHLISKIKTFQSSSIIICNKNLNTINISPSYLGFRISKTKMFNCDNQTIFCNNKTFNINNVRLHKQHQDSFITLNRNKVYYKRNVIPFWKEESIHKSICDFSITSQKQRKIFSLITNEKFSYMLLKKKKFNENDLLCNMQKHMIIECLGHKKTFCNLKTNTMKKEENGILCLVNKKYYSNKIRSFWKKEEMISKQNEFELKQTKHQRVNSIYKVEMFSLFNNIKNILKGNNDKMNIETSVRVTILSNKYIRNKRIFISQNEKFTLNNNGKKFKKHHLQISNLNQIFSIISSKNKSFKNQVIITTNQTISFIPKQIPSKYLYKMTNHLFSINPISPKKFKTTKPTKQTLLFIPNNSKIIKQFFIFQQNSFTISSQKQKHLTISSPYFFCFISNCCTKWIKHLNILPSFTVSQFTIPRKYMFKCTREHCFCLCHNTFRNPNSFRCSTGESEIIEDDGEGYHVEDNQCILKDNNQSQRNIILKITKIQNDNIPLIDNENDDEDILNNISINTFPERKNMYNQCIQPVKNPNKTIVTISEKESKKEETEFDMNNEESDDDDDLIENDDEVMISQNENKYETNKVENNDTNDNIQLVNHNSLKILHCKKNEGYVMLREHPFYSNSSNKKDEY